MANMLLTGPARDSDIVIADFGFAEYAQTLAETYRGVNSTNDLRGTPLLLAPEVFLGNPQSEKSDVWSAGVVMYELLTRSHPYLPYVDVKRRNTNKIVGPLLG